MQRTNAMRILDKAKIKYNTYTYEAGDGHINGVSVCKQTSPRCQYRYLKH